MDSIYCALRHRIDQCMARHLPFLSLFLIGSSAALSVRGDEAPVLATICLEQCPTARQTPPAYCPPFQNSYMVQQTLRRLSVNNGQMYV